jgi:hypothetical protein
MKKFIFIGLIAMSVFFTQNAFAVNDCSRSPLDDPVSNNETISISCVDMDWSPEGGSPCIEGEPNTSCVYQQFALDDLNTMLPVFCSAPVLVASTFSWSGSVSPLISNQVEGYIYGSMSDSVDGNGCFTDFISGYPKFLVSGGTFTLISGSGLADQGVVDLSISVTGSVKDTLISVLGDTTNIIIVGVGVFLIAVIWGLFKKFVKK